MYSVSCQETGGRQSQGVFSVACACGMVSLDMHGTSPRGAQIVGLGAVVTLRSMWGSDWPHGQLKVRARYLGKVAAVTHHKRTAQVQMLYASGALNSNGIVLNAIPVPVVSRCSMLQCVHASKLTRFCVSSSAKPPVVPVLVRII